MFVQVLDKIGNDSMKTKKVPQCRIFKGASRVEKLMSFLQLHGYKCVMKKEYFEAWFYRRENIHYPASYYVGVFVEHPQIVAMFCNINDTSYQNLSGYIGIDTKYRFNKWTQVPITISLDESFDVILDYLKKMETTKFSDSLENPDLIRDDFTRDMNKIHQTDESTEAFLDGIAQ